MNAPIASFRKHLGERGVHVFSGEDCRFLTWQESIAYINKFPQEDEEDFGCKLLHVLANYDPDSEFLAVEYSKDTATIQLYNKIS